MGSETVAAQIGHAWRHQRNGEADKAIQEFERILQQNPDNIDALYGMGLAQRTAGHSEQAAKCFQQALELIEAGDLTGRKLREDTANDVNDRIKPNSPEEDRYMMLSRMLKQRLTELNLAN
jgi:tetratricopeptide (TPR) repeat protein